MCQNSLATSVARNETGDAVPLGLGLTAQLCLMFWTDTDTHAIAVGATSD